MVKQPPDFTFKRRGRSLAKWLWDLVSEDAPTRRAAGEALQAMVFGVPSVHTDLTEIDWGSPDAISNQQERFKDAVRSVVKSSKFNAPAFVRKLILYQMWLKDDWRRRMDASRERADASNIYQDRLLQRLQAADGDDRRAEVARRYMRWVCASLARGLNRSEGAFAGAESTAACGTMALAVFRSLDVRLLDDRPGLRAMLADGQLRHLAVEALARIGPPAVDFAEVFLAGLDAKQSAPLYFDGARALGSIGRDDPGVIDGLLMRLRSGSVAVRSGAAAALRHAGPPLAGRLHVALDLLLEASHAPDVLHAAIPALASVGRDSESALRRVLGVAAPRPPRWRTADGFPDYQYDEAMMERGVALDSLEHFKRFADRVVPVLLDSLDTFDEYDSDWSYHGEHGRVCHALESFGPSAAPAVPRLVRYLTEWLARPEQEREQPKDVFRVLAAIGPPAAEALPLLDQIRAERFDDEPALAELDPDDPLDRAIIGIREA